MSEMRNSEADNALATKMARIFTSRGTVGLTIDSHMINRLRDALTNQSNIFYGPQRGYPKALSMLNSRPML